MTCAVCGLPVVRRILCPGCWLVWRAADAPCSQEGFEAWAEQERKALVCASAPPP